MKDWPTDIKKILPIVTSLAVLGLGFLLYGLELTFPAFGMSWHSSDGEIYAIAHGGAASLAGIKKGDRVLTFEGVPLTERGAFRKAWHALLPGEIAAVEISRDNDLWIAEIRSESGIPFLDGYAIYYIVALVFWLAGVIVFFSNPPDAKASLVYLIFCLSASTALFTNTRLNVTYTTWTGFLQRTATGLSMGALLHFSLLYPEKKQNRIDRLPLLLTSIYLPGLIAGLIAGYIVAWRRFDIHWISNLPFVAFGLVFLLWVLSLWHTYRTTTMPDVKAHLHEMATGLTLSLLPFVALVVPGAIMGRAIMDMRIVTASLIAFPLALTYAIFHGQTLTGLTVWVRRGFVYLGLSLIFSFIYVGGTILISWAWWDTTLNWVELTIGWLAALPAAMLVVALKPGMGRAVERWFFTTDDETERQK